MTFKKLALATAIACAVPAAFAADYIADDASLGGVTGQDGIIIGLDLAVTTDMIIHDTDGIDLGVPAYATGYSFDGAIVMSNVGLNTFGNQIVVAVDAGDNATSFSAPMLNVNVTIPGGTQVQTGSITVANSRRDDGAWGFDNATATIVESATLTLSGNTVANIQLGNETQGHMIRLNTVIGGGVSLTGMAINDLNGSPLNAAVGSIGAGQIDIVDNGGSNLTLDIGVDADAVDGLVVSLDTLGSVGGIDIRQQRVYLGTTALGYIGDVEMVGLNLNGSSIAIRGK